MSNDDSQPSFQDLGLAKPVLKALDDVGYEKPTPIQAQCIPHILAGNDLLGQAQTGTGKTAAFALPILSNIHIDGKDPQILILAPTRELAIQVAEAFQSYARYLPNFHVLPLYGGQSYSGQLRQLRRGVHVVVGTPGRIMDHIRRRTLKLENLTTLVLDEGDEMLRMGFIEDVEWILARLPESRQIALFSATMPDLIRKVARKHLRQPKEIKVVERTTAANTIRQRYWQVSGLHKLDALTRILETEKFAGMLIFVRTKNATIELAQKLSARGHACEALNGDIQQKLRERTVERLKNGRIDIVIATDVAARGLDIERVSHVLNYDIPYDTESYVHRIGRTGRAGRNGEAILFVAPRERRMLKTIERTTHQSIEPMQMPTATDINQQRIVRFKEKISATLTTQDLDVFYQIVEEFQDQHDVAPLQIAAALARMAQGDAPMLLPEKEPKSERITNSNVHKMVNKNQRSASSKALLLKDFPDVEMERFQVSVGYQHRVKPGNIVGAIANEADIEHRYIGQIEIYETFSTVDLPAGMPNDTFRALKRTVVCGRKLEIIRLRSGEKASVSPERSKTRRTPKRNDAGKRTKTRAKRLA